jgi:predicted ribosome quality control (RQC) complex YloA/Tae2 family protein
MIKLDTLMKDYSAYSQTRQKELSDAFSKDELEQVNIKQKELNNLLDKNKKGLENINTSYKNQTKSVNELREKFKDYKA